MPLWMLLHLPLACEINLVSIGFWGLKRVIFSKKNTQARLKLKNVYQTYPFFLLLHEFPNTAKSKTHFC